MGVPKRVEKSIPIEVSDDLVPEHLKRFICVSMFEPRVTIKRTGPREIDDDTADSLISHLCKASALNVNLEADKDVVCGNEEGSLWPNPILGRFRQSVKSGKNSRLEELWRSSNSHGISWDALDKLYMAFRDARDSNAEEWEKHAAEIADFASKIARAKIMNWLGESQTCPPRLLRKWTHLIYSRWKERYMHVYSPRMLSRFLKGEVTDRVLMREVNECAEKGARISELPFSTDASEHNPHFVRRIAKPPEQNN